MAVTAGPSPTDAAPVRSWRAWLNQYSWLGMGFAFTLSIFYLVMFVIPFGTAIWLSFHNWDYIQRPVFVNTRNFDKLLGDPGFWNALWTTVRFSAVEIFVALSLAPPARARAQPPAPRLPVHAPRHLQPARHHARHRQRPALEMALPHQRRRL